jgi:hypothetical protein
MSDTNDEKSNLARFGCAFSPKENAIRIYWEKERKAQVLSANLAVRIIYQVFPSGPILSLAFEISLSKSLAQYCYFPFDLKNKAHRKYLSIIIGSREIQLRFLAGTHQIARIYELPPERCNAFARICASAVEGLEQFPPGRYEYKRAVEEFEQSVRIIDCFQYAISDSDMERLIHSCAAQAEQVAPETRAKASRIANELINVFRSRYDSYLREQLKAFPSYAHNLLFMADVHTAFEGNYSGFNQFFTNAIAVHLTEDSRQQLQTWIPALEALFTLIDHLTEPRRGTDEAFSQQVRDDLLEITNRVKAGRGLSFESLANLLSMIGLPVGGRPGRPTKDYSVEHELRKEGKTWRQIAEHRLKNDEETRREFGNRGIRELTPEQRSTLMHRVREGVRSFAERKKIPGQPTRHSP